MEQITLFIALVELTSQILCREDQSQGTRVALDELLGEVNGDKGGAAAHATEVEALQSRFHFEPIGHQGAEGRGRAEDGTIHDEVVHVLSVRGRLME